MRPSPENDAPRVQVRAAAAAAAMVVLLAVAAIATRGDGTGSTAPPGAGAASSAGHHALIVALVVLTPILAVLGAGLFIYAHIYRMRERDPETIKRMKRRRRLVAIAFLIFLAYVAFSIRIGRQPFGFLHLRNPFAGAPSGHAGGPGLHRTSPVHPTITSSDWTAVVVIWIVLLAAAAFLVVRYRTSRSAVQLAGAPMWVEEPTEPEVARLLRERNPRRAVIAAYAAMERLMARDGLPRGAHEAPMEYLGRVTLQGHHRVAAVHRLTALFQWARFSRRPVDEEMRGSAIAAVEELEGDQGAGE